MPNKFITLIIRLQLTLIHINWVAIIECESKSLNFQYQHSFSLLKSLIYKKMKMGKSLEHSSLISTRAQIMKIFQFYMIYFLIFKLLQDSATSIKLSCMAETITKRLSYCIHKNCMLCHYINCCTLYHFSIYGRVYYIV